MKNVDFIINSFAKPQHVVCEGVKCIAPFRNLKNKRYWGKHFLSRGDCFDTVCLDIEVIRKYARYQDPAKGWARAISMIILVVTEGQRPVPF